MSILLFYIYFFKLSSHKKSFYFETIVYSRTYNSVIKNPISVFTSNKNTKNVIKMIILRAFKSYKLHIRA